jgi:uncharacterized membrane protein
VSNLDLRPLSLGELLDRCFTLYRRHFFLFIGIVGLPYLVTLAIQLVQIFVFFPSNLFGTGSTLPGQPPFGTPSAGAIVSLILFYVVMIIAAIVAYLLAQGGTVFAVSELYLGRPATIRGSLRKMRGRMLSLLGLVILNGLIIGGCAFAAAIPLFILIPLSVGLAGGGAGGAALIGISFLLLFTLVIAVAFYMACRLLVAIPAALLEDAGPVTALQRSFALTKKNAGRAFLVMLISVAITGAVVSVLAIPPYIGMLVSMMAKHFETMRLWLALFQGGVYIGEALAGPILIIATSVFYFDLRVRKEALDLQMMIAPVGSPEPLTGGAPRMLS